MELFQLEQFLSIAGNGSLHEAAKACFVTESALSQSLKKLEKELGMELFERKNHRLYLNRNGKALQIHAREICSRVDSCLYEMNSLRSVEKGSIHVGATDTGFISYILPSFIARCTDYHVERTLYHDNDRLRRSLIRGEIDVAVGPQKMDEKNYDIENLALLKEKVYISVPVSNPLYNKEFLLPEDISGEPFIREDSDSARRLDRYLASQHSFPNNIAVVDRVSFDLMQHAEDYLYVVNTCRLLHYHPVEWRRLIKLKIDAPDIEPILYLSCLSGNKDAQVMYRWFRNSFASIFRRANHDILQKKS